MYGRRERSASCYGLTKAARQQVRCAQHRSWAGIVLRVNRVQSVPPEASCNGNTGSSRSRRLTAVGMPWRLVLGR